MSACTDPYDPGQRAIDGGLFGAGTGAAIGGIAGGGRGAATGALIGGALGAVGGAATTPSPDYYGYGSSGSGYNRYGSYGPRYYDLPSGNLGDFCGTPVPNFPERARLLNDIVELPFRSWLASVKVSTTASGGVVMGKSKPKHILLAEDYDPVREHIANMLEDRGYRVSTVSAGASMRDFLRTDDRVDAIVLNAATPGENGASLARHAKDLGLPVVMISGSNDEISFAAQHGLQLLRKPVQAEELYGALDRALFSGEFGQRSA